MVPPMPTTLPTAERESDPPLAAGEEQRGTGGLLSGEPGIGKSRLSAELVRQIETEPHIRLRYFCAPHHQDSALYPFIVLLERAAGFAREDSPDERRAKLEVLLAPAFVPQPQYMGREGARIQLDVIPWSVPEITLTIAESLSI